MKVHFEPNLDYQLLAIEAVCGLFRGQEICRTEFTVTASAAGGTLLPGMESDLGIGNRLTLLDDEILKNLHDVQLRHGLPGAAFAGQEIAAIGGGQEILRAAFDDPQAVIMQFEI